METPKIFENAQNFIAAYDEFAADDFIDEALYLIDGLLVNPYIGRKVPGEPGLRSAPLGAGARPFALARQGFIIGAFASMRRPFLSRGHLGDLGRVDIQHSLQTNPATTSTKAA